MEILDLVEGLQRLPYGTSCSIWREWRNEPEPEIKKCDDIVKETKATRGIWFNIGIGKEMMWGEAGKEDRGYFVKGLKCQAKELMYFCRY